MRNIAILAVIVLSGLLGATVGREPGLRVAHAQSAASGEINDIGSVWSYTAPGSGLAFTTNKRPLQSASAFRIDVCLGASSVFQVVETDGTATFTNDLNSGTALTAGAVYTFVMESRKTTPGTTTALQYNFKVSAGTVIRSLRVTEVLGGAM